MSVAAARGEGGGAQDEGRLARRGASIATRSLARRPAAPAPHARYCKVTRRAICCSRARESRSALCRAALAAAFAARALADARGEWRNHRATRDKHGDSAKRRCAPGRHCEFAPVPGS